MAFDDPTAIDGLSLSSLEWRRGMSGLFAHTADSLSAMPGVLHGFSCTVASLTLTVAAGSAVITPSAGSNGSYIAVANAAETVTITAQDATYARIDRVVLRIYDTQVDGSGYSKAAVEIIAGAPAASPVAPTLPTGRLEIAQLQVPKSGAGGITVVDRRPYAAAVGGPILVPSSSSLPTGSFLRFGQRALTVDKDREYRWNGAAWVDVTPAVGQRTGGTAALSASEVVLSWAATPVAIGGIAASGNGLSVEAAGTYRVLAHAEFQGMPAGSSRDLLIKVNGSTLQTVATTVPPNLTTYAIGHVDYITSLAAGDVVTVSTTGSSTTGSSWQARTWVSVQKVGS